MTLPTLPRPKAKSIAELLASQRKIVPVPSQPKPSVAQAESDPASLPLGGKSLADLSHESEIAALSVPAPTPKLVAPTGLDLTRTAMIVRDGKVLPVGLAGLPRFIPAHSPEARPLIAASVAKADAAIADSNKLLFRPSAASFEVQPESEDTESNIDDDNEKLERLIDDDFPFDETQLAAVHGMVIQQYAAMVGEAGTGKTTVTKKLVDLLKTGVAMVDLSGYWKRGNPEDADDYERPEHLIPSICLCSFTGRASQMIKKNFPRSWHPNIMTIHRMLGFYPEFYEDTAPNGEVVNKKRFVPAYGPGNPVPWKIIVIDEVGMLGLDLWHQLLAACLPDTRIYFIGDIRQLPPTHGKSILGFALAKWPVFALTHVHRQKGVNNSIVDNAHRVMNGVQPICDSTILAEGQFKRGMSFVTPEDTTKALKWLATNDEWRFLKIRVDENPNKAQQRIRQVINLLYDKTKLYEPSRDIIITPTNGFEPTAPGYVLGQMPLNQGLVSLLNAGATRYWIDAGRERQNFAVGDKVMATVNDYEAGITNGMTGIIEEIRINGDYSGNPHKVGPVNEVADYLESLDSDQDEEDFDLDEMIQNASELLNNQEKEKRDTGPASHSIVVRFGEGEHGFTVDFRSKSQVASLMLAYAATCHKMQGGEAPLVFVIVHGTQKRPLNREWLYTAITRASGRCIVLYTSQGLGTALAKKAIEGRTLEEKIQSFVKLTIPNAIGAKMNVKLPEPRELVNGE